jgi:pilus assembly protein CpaE
VKAMNSQAINVSVLFVTGVPNPEYREFLAGMDGIKFDGEVRDPEAFLTQNQAQPADLALVDLDGSTTLPGWLESLIDQMPQTEVMVCSHSRDPDFLIKIMKLRAGGFLSLPLDRKEFSSLLLRVREEKQKRHYSGDGQILVLAGAKGGVGTTSIATNLAVALAECNDGGVVLVDLARPFPHVGQFLDLVSSHSIKDLVDSASNLDQIFVKKIVQKHHSNLEVLLSHPQFHLDFPLVNNIDAMGKIFPVLRTAYDWVVVDLGTSLDRFSAWMLRQADQIFLVTELDIPNLQNLKIIRTLFRDWDINEHNVKFMVNRHTRDYALGLKDLENIFPQRIFYTLPSDYLHLIEAINQGEPLGERTPRSKLWRRLRELAAELVEQSKPETDRQMATRPGLLRRLF